MTDGGGAADEAADVAGVAAPVDEPDTLDAEEVLEDAREDALDFLEGLLDAMEADGDVAADITEDGAIAAEITGGDGGLLIGSRGQTLEAMQELLRTVVQRQAQTRVRVTLDVEGYRERRKEAVRRLAEQMAERALAEGEVELEPMNAYERKIVHEAVAGIAGISSVSEGQDPRRRVLIRRDT
ncbi:MAG TPA: RNA-binding cell elongation regulator Jag/EloR [Actinomycetota bacterium]|nr:RNA-binding cell elongation regulator Jag/EloR [Actinomycetota bacterium]